MPVTNALTKLLGVRHPIGLAAMYLVADARLIHAPLFGELAQRVAESQPLRPKPLSQDGLLALFKSEAVGRGVQLEPASNEDMCGSAHVERPSLEIVYDTV